jgi:hypothetical protein
MFRMTYRSSARSKRSRVAHGIVTHSVEVNVQYHVRNRPSDLIMIDCEQVERPQMDRSWLRFSEVHGDRTRIERDYPC